MSDSIVAGYTQKHAQGIEILAQQLTEMTMGTVDARQLDGKRQQFDQMGAIRMQKKIGRAVPPKTVEVPQKARFITALDYQIRDFVDDFDKLKVFNDPTNDYTTVQAAAAARETDQILINAALGTVLEGEDGSISTPFPASQVVNDGGFGFTLPKLQEAVGKIKRQNALLPTDSLHCFWTEAQEREFINTTEVKSSEFNNTKVMVDGELRNFYKVNFHRIEDFEDNADGRILPFASSIRTCVLWARSGMLLGTWKAPSGKVEWNVERQAWQITMDMSRGALRRQDSKVVAIKCKVTP